MPVAGPLPRRLPPADDPALPARLARRSDRPGVGRRSLDRAPLDPPLPAARRRWLARPAPQRPSPTGQPAAWRAPPDRAHPTPGLDHPQAVAGGGSSTDQPADPAPAGAPGRQLAAAAPGR